VHGQWSFSRLVSGHSDDEMCHLRLESYRINTAGTHSNHYPRLDPVTAATDVMTPIYTGARCHIWYIKVGLVGYALCLPTYSP